MWNKINLAWINVFCIAGSKQGFIQKKKGKEMKDLVCSEELKSKKTVFFFSET